MNYDDCRDRSGPQRPGRAGSQRGRAGAAIARAKRPGARYARACAPPPGRWAARATLGAAVEVALHDLGSTEVRPLESLDADEIRLALGGDSSAFGRLVDRHQAGIAAYLWRFSRELPVHDELVQDVFVEAWRSLRGFRGDGPLAHWLKQIATRVGYRYWRRRERERRSVQLSGDCWPELPAATVEPDAARDAAATVHRLLERLPRRDRLVLTLLYLEENTVAEAALLTGWSATMVKVQAYRARRKLKRLLEEKRP